MAVLDTATSPSLLSRLTSPWRKFKRTAWHRHAAADLVLEDFLDGAIRPGDKVLQLGAANHVTACMLARGAFMALVAPPACAEAVDAICQLRGCSSGRLRLFASIGGSSNAGEMDAVWLSRTLSLAQLAAHYRHAQSRLNTGGTLYLDGLDTAHGKSLFKQLNKDDAWRLDEVLSGEIAVFRTI
ncbi:hypothetical protein [Hyphobacterium sp.]|uniref:hypothetical protein n=1 Tax=Hyphobacterium sp. TaxID=2004662 RepID=UPI003BA97B36